MKNIYTMVSREINPDLIKNVQKYIDWMPKRLAHEVSKEIIRDNYSTALLGLKFDDDRCKTNLSGKLAYLIAAMARNPTKSSPIDQTEWVKSIINDLRITPVESDPRVKNWDIAEFLGNDKYNWNDGYARGWNGEMWTSLLDGLVLNEGVDLFKREKKRGLNYGVALPEIIFSERQSNFNFLNWNNLPWGDVK